MSQARILVADDEAAIADLVAHVLTSEGFEAKAVYSGADALAELLTGSYSLGVLDIMMPGIDGFEVRRRVRAASDVPIVFLSAKDEEVDQVVGLSLGADDYVCKPFSPRVLAARVKARLRTREHPEASPGAVEEAGIRVDESCHEASFLGAPLRLTPKEFGILAALVRAGGAPVAARDLYEEVWGEPFSLSAGNSVMVHIRHLREKLAEIDSSRDCISTVWGVGYRVATGAGTDGAL